MGIEPWAGKAGTPPLQAAWERVTPWIAARRWSIAAVTAVVALAPVLRGDRGDWHYFVEGSRLLFGSAPGGGLDLFGSHQDLQVGPLSLVVAEVVRVASPGSGFAAAAVLTMALGLATLVLVESTATRIRGAVPALAIGLGGPFFLESWSSLASIGHIDDALALTFGALALFAAVRRSPVLAGVAVGLAVASKPWAIFFLPVLLVLPARRIAGFCWAVAVGAAAWAPFVVADRRTIEAGAYTIYNWPDSTLRVFGVDSLTTPHWVRPVQLAACLAAGAFAVWRGRWFAIPFAAVAVRLLLDGGTYTYYFAGLLLGALLVDAARGGVPWTAIGVFAATRGLATVFPDAEGRGVARTIVLAACLVLAISRVAASAAGPSGQTRRGRHDPSRAGPSTPPAGC